MGCLGTIFQGSPRSWESSRHTRCTYSRCSSICGGETRSQVTTTTTHRRESDHCEPRDNNDVVERKI